MKSNQSASAPAAGPAALAFLALVGSGPLLAGPALGVPSPTVGIVGPAPVAGSVVSFSGTGYAPGTARIVVIPASLVGAPDLTVACYLGTPTALATADATVDGAGALPATATWVGAVPGSYRAYVLQGSCAPAASTRPGIDAAQDQRIIGTLAFAVGAAADVPGLSGWGVAAFGAALAAAGWALVSRVRA